MTWTRADRLYEFATSSICGASARAEAIAQGESIRLVPREQLKVWSLHPGDLIFFDLRSEGVITHTAIVTARRLNASGQVDLIMSQHYGAPEHNLNVSLRDRMDATDEPWRLYPVHVKDEFSVCEEEHRQARLPTGSYERSCSACVLSPINLVETLTCQSCRK